MRYFLKIYVFVLIICIQPLLSAFPRDQVIQNIKGPWELTVSLGGVQDSGLVFPVTVDNEDVQQTLNKIFPVIGSPIQVKVTQYCPNLKWKTVVEEDPKGGPVAFVTVAGKGSQQEINLLADVPEKRAVTASIGGLAIRNIHQSQAQEEFLKKMARQKALGILKFWANADSGPQEFIIKPGESFEIPGTSYKAEVLEYMPHYSIDRETKEVKNYSDRPVNPALKVRLSNEQETYEQWIWSNFAASPHAMSKFPLRVEFCDFDPGPSGIRYFIVITEGLDVWLYYKKAGGVKIEKCLVNHPYPFQDKEYSFTLDSVLAHGLLKRKWENVSGKLQHPAVVISVESDDISQEIVLEINQPAHVKTAYGALVLNFRQKAQTKQHGTR